MYHFRKTRHQYESYPEPVVCSFCDDADLHVRAVRETKHAYVVPNRTFYDMWELSRVVDHLLVIPKAHVVGLAELSDEAKLEIMNIVADYELHDYNVYARTAKNIGRSVGHQHTHLIKTKHKKAWFFMYIRRPYWLVRF